MPAVITPPTGARRRARHAALALALAGSGAASATPVSAHGLDPVAGASARPSVDEHEALHAAVDRQARAWARSPEGRRARRTARPWRSRDRVRPLPRARAAVAGAPADIGRWGAPFGLPTPAIHSILLPTGKILFFSERLGRDNTAQAWLVTPTTGELKRVDPPLWRDPGDGVVKPANIFCGGQTLLADGRVLVTGGNLEYKSNEGNSRGLNKAYTFNPYDETWTEQPDMRHGRWYPSQALLPNGETLIVGGRNETGDVANYNTDVEIFTPSPDLNGRGTMRLVSPRDGTPHLKTLYPHLFVMPSGRVLAAGPELKTYWFFNGADATSFGWSDAANARLHRKWGSSVLMPGGPNGSTRVMQLGGAGYGEGESSASTEVFDETTNAWTPGGDMQVPRGHHNTVLLPDGSMVNVGGGTGSGPRGIYQFDAAHRQIELYDPATGAWRLGPEQAEGRAYHSTAVLLPDGRVLSAGDNGNGGKLLDTGEIYEPPYLHRGGQRPAIDFAPGAVRYGARFGVGTRSPDVTRAVLVAPAATTHGTDMNQRHLALPLERRADGRGVDLVAPTGPAAAPPGPYMLFLLDSRGVPSVARFVRLGQDAPDAPALPGDGAPAPNPRSNSTPTRRGGRRSTTRSMRGLLARGASVRVRCSRTCTARVTLVVDRRTARRLRLTRRVVARGSRRLGARGTARVVVRLTPEARRRLRRVRTLRVTMRTTVTPSRGRARRTSRTVIFRR